MTPQQREAVIAEAREWLRTPFHHRGRIKGGGVDCAMLLAEVYERAGVIQHVPSEYYPRDWYVHRDEERFIGWVMARGGVEIQGPPQPGDVAVYRFGRCFSHGAIVVEWPKVIIHAFYMTGKCEYAHGQGGLLSDRPVKFFTLSGDK